jgi:hypothetical protein
VSRPELLHLATPSKERRSLRPFEGRHASKAWSAKTTSRRRRSLRIMGVATTPTIVAWARGRPPEEMITTSTFGMSSPKRGLPKAPTATVTMAMRVATTMEVATTAVTTVETMAMKTPLDSFDVLSNLPSIHWGSLHVGRWMSPSHGSDEASYGGFGACSWRQLQVP